MTGHWDLDEQEAIKFNEELDRRDARIRRETIEQNKNESWQLGYIQAITDMCEIISRMKLEDANKYQDMIKLESEKDDPDYEAIIATKRINQIAGTTYNQISDKLVDMLMQS